MNNKNISIIGGGTAGWLSALYLNKVLKHSNITLIENSKIDILGAGEGTTPIFPYILKKLGIDDIDFFNKSKSSLKYGVQFTNWKGDGTSFLHTFFDDDSHYAYHFDARLVAKYFKDIAIKRGVTHIDSDVIGVRCDMDNITEIVLKDKEDIKTDFVIDCTGFARMLIGNHYKSKWKSYKEDLIADSAIAFFLPSELEVTRQTKTYTQSIAMNSGWMWMIDLQHRRGCGYVFNSNFISIEEAKKEVEEYIGKEIEIVKTFKFNPGCFEETWIGNCVAIGLSSGFLEPLEATSIATAIQSLQELRRSKFKEKNRDSYNKFVATLNEQNMLFVRHHYDCVREDTPFWKYYKSLELPTKLNSLYDTSGNFCVTTDSELLEKLTNNDASSLAFRAASYIVVNKLKKTKTKVLI